MYARQLHDCLRPAACSRAAIEKLRYQNAKLKEELLLENKFSVRPSDPGAARLINKLQDEADLYTRKVRVGREGTEGEEGCAGVGNWCSAGDGTEVLA